MTCRDVCTYASSNNTESKPAVLTLRGRGSFVPVPPMWLSFRCAPFALTSAVPAGVMDLLGPCMVLCEALDMSMHMQV
jgi:hypothetical protein